MPLATSIQRPPYTTTACVQRPPCTTSLMCYCHLVNIYAHTRLTALCPGLPGWAGTRKAKPIWILLKQETVRGSGIGWAICKSAPCSWQITMPTHHHSVFLQAGCPSCRPTNSVKALMALLPSGEYHWNKLISMDQTSVCGQNQQTLVAMATSLGIKILMLDWSSTSTVLPTLKIWQR